MQKFIVLMSALMTASLVGCQNSNNNSSQKLSEAIEKVKTQVEQAVRREKNDNEMNKSDQQKTEDQKRPSGSETLDPGSSD